MSTAAKLRLAVLGCGSIGRRHLANLKAAGLETLAYDPSPEVRAEVASKLGVPTVDALEAVWAGHPDAVLVTAPPNLHVPLALEAVRHGCHVFVEKPLSHSEAGLEQLLEESAERRLVTMVGCNMRFHPGPRMLKRLLTEGSIGEPLSARVETGSYLPGWRPWQDYRKSYSASTEWGGAVLDCIHEIDLALWYFGPATVIGVGIRPATVIGLTTDGLAEILLNHASGTLSSVHLNFIERDYRRKCTVIGSRGTLNWDFGAGQVQIFGENGALAEVISNPVGWSVNQMYQDELDHFVESVRAGRSTENPLSDGWSALKIALKARAGKPMEAS